MRVDSEEQRKMLLEIIDGTSYTVSGSALIEVASNVQKLKLAVSNAPIDEQEETPALELSKE